jgi:glycosyltransferase involved in cell wall biosynthesis
MVGLCLSESDAPERAPMSEALVEPPLPAPHVQPPQTPAAAVTGGDDGPPLRILLPSYRSHKYTGGQGVYMRHISKALVDLGHRVDVISGPPYPELDPRVRLIRLESLDLYAKPKVFLGLPAMPKRAFTSWTDFYEYMAHISGAFAEPNTFGMRLAQYMKGRAHEYDVVHDNQTLCWGLLDLQKMGLPVVGTIHHPITMDRRISIAAADTISLNLLVRRWYSFLNMQIKVARKLDPVIVVSEATRRDVATDFGLDPDRLNLVHHGIDTETFRPLPHVARKSNRLMATASADVPLKGLVYLIEAYHQLLTRYPDLELHVVGSLREGHTDNLLRKLGIRDRVVFRSDLSSEDIVEMYAEATMAVCPSVYEGFGFPAGEAMACGVPVVSTTGGALPEVVGDAGVLVPPKDPAALAAAIADMLDNPEKRAAIGAAGRRRVLSTFRWDITAGNVVKIYRKAIAHAHGRPQIATA